jgi:hypothetical protein
MVKAAIFAVAATGCSLIEDNFQTNGFSGDPYPIDVETTSGAVVVGLREDGVADRVAVLDLLSPVTLADPGPDAQPSVTNVNLTLLGAEGPGGPIDRPRALFTDAQLIAAHPCDTDECEVGPVATPRAYEAVVGANAVAGDAVRVRLGDDQIFILPDVAGDETARSLACDAVMPSPFRGGGTLVIGGTELPFTGRRITLGACLGPDPDEHLDQSERGADVLLLISTGIGTSILGESAYARYRQAHSNVPPDLGTLPTDSVNLPSGPISGHRTSIPSVALVAASPGAPRAPCRQVYSHHLLAARECLDPTMSPCTIDSQCASQICGTDGQCFEDCPCDTNQFSCFVPAILELTPPTGIDVLVVSDDEPTLQSLRAELRPDQPEVDGILGTQALRTAEIDADYPNDRVLGRCSDDSCLARPELSPESQRASVQSCIGHP